ncbi:hypothetical protein [Acetonema longum]|uniref:Stage III sporulation protein AG n=1 Tax=Acetonema longum DSM 6540 TaxID=1009370 RepID=F7NJX6_9FIRM|nr:hypothetical protein [Acetonema longum]EGO63623.1 hypothetical protein ALO_11929 [Acetonema longum DSM 6540]
MSSGQSWIAGAKKFGSELARAGVWNFKLIALGILGVVLMLLGGIFPAVMQPAPAGQEVKPGGQAPASVSRGFEEGLEVKLANLLSQVRGAGAVAVNVTLESGNMQEYAKNVVKETKIVQEKDNAGGIRSTTESKETENILVSRENGIDRPVMVRETKPVIRGVLVIAEGAGDSYVKANLTRAVEASLGIPSYKITVLPQRK